MSEVSRRDLLKNIALSATLGSVSLEAAQHVHGVATQEKAASGVYKPKSLNAHEYRTLQKLADFLQSTYDAAADLAHWDRAALEREPVAP